MWLNHETPENLPLSNIEFTNHIVQKCRCIDVRQEEQMTWKVHINQDMLKFHSKQVVENRNINVASDL